MLINPTIQLVVFDMAGTTIHDDDAVNRCLRDALAVGGVTASRDDINLVMGLPKPLAIRDFLTRTEGRPPAAQRVQELHDEFLTRMIRHYQSDPGIREMPGASDVFRALRKAGVLVALDTGFSRPIVNVLLDRLGWQTGDLLATTVTSDEVPRGRPHPDLLFEAMKRTGVTDVRRVAKVGDTPSDLGEGTSAGCALVVGVTNGTHTAAQLTAHPHTHLINSLSELLPLVLPSSATPTRT